MLKEGDLVVPAPTGFKPRAWSPSTGPPAAGIGIVVRAVAIDYGRGKIVNRYKVFWFLSQTVSPQPLKDSDLTKLA